MKLVTPDFGLVFWMVLTFLTVLFLLAKFAWKPILSTLKERETGIAESIAMADRVKAEMALLQNENETLMQKAREERAVMMKEAKDTSDKIINAAKEQAKVEANKIVADANQQIYNQKMAALTDVKNQVGTLVVEVAEKVLRRELSDKAGQEKFISELAGAIKLN